MEEALIAAKSLGLKLPWLCFYRPLVPRAWRRASLGHTCSRSRATPATASNGPLESCCNRRSLTSSGSRSGWSGCREGRGKQVLCVGHVTLLSVLRSCVAARVLSFCWLLELPPAELTFLVDHHLTRGGLPPRPRPLGVHSLRRFLASCPSFSSSTGASRSAGTSQLVSALRSCADRPVNGATGSNSALYRRNVLGYQIHNVVDCCVPPS